MDFFFFSVIRMSFPFHEMYIKILNFFSNSVNFWVTMGRPSALSDAEKAKIVSFEGYNCA